ncbi:pep-cterm sorting domain-containing protein [Anaeramoeba ignava]|uniref:Pep-cterm sorting domain-containing protein n=1 Tax=Anaeramoeba ignava TaxID=1746090 RepID=A0A9Q0RAR8_ANAIG|nr:pep-cterm sorting domain-containing protein [Anaeramoeba ignava]|eukprot:Anaeramoba_ignava/a481538_481.p1 GENE.a481538_481~~a481538_481.p1  ORF type:complete len:480 (-),score=168.35 a481538_481:48-1487(-)
MQAKFENSNKLSADLQKLFKFGKTFSDFNIVSPNPKTNLEEAIPCHKPILAFRSKYFENLFNSNPTINEEKHNEITFFVMNQLIEYIYSGTIEVTLENAIEIFIYSKKFQLEEVHSFVSKFIMDNPNLDTIVDVLNTAKKIESKEVYTFCLDYIIANFQAILETKQLFKLDNDDFEKNLDDSCIDIANEKQLFAFCIEWAQNKLKMEIGIDKLPLQDITKITDILSPFFNKIRFCDMKQEELDEVRKLEVVPEEILEHIFHFKDMINKSQKKEASALRIFLKEKGIFILEPRNKLRESLVIKKLEHERFLRDWVNEDVFFNDMKLKYSAKKNGFSAKLFHEMCDNNGKTLVLVRTTDGYVFGGFSDVGWSANLGDKKNITDPNAFIFSLVNPSNSPPIKMPVLPEKAKYAIGYWSNQGPDFGRNGNEILFNSALSGGWINLGCVYQLPDHLEYDSSEAKEFLTGSFSDWRIEEMEIYQI